MLQIDPGNVCYVIIKAREFFGKVAVVDSDSASNMADDGMLDVLEDRASDPVQSELTEFMDALNEDEQIDLVALMWLGRSDGNADDWRETRAEASRAHNDHTTEYLMGTPLLADYLTEGLSKLGYETDTYELEHL